MTTDREERATGTGESPQWREDETRDDEMRDIGSTILKDIITAQGGSTAAAEGRMASNSDRRDSAEVHAGGNAQRPPESKT